MHDLSLCGSLCGELVRLMAFSFMQIFMRMLSVMESGMHYKVEPVYAHV